MEHIKTGMIFPEKNEYNILQALTITVGASFWIFSKLSDILQIPTCD